MSFIDLVIRKRPCGVMGAFLQRTLEEVGYMSTPGNMDSQLAPRIVLHDFATDAWIISTFSLLQNETTRTLKAH